MFEIVYFFVFLFFILLFFGFKRENILIKFWIKSCCKKNMNVDSIKSEKGIFEFLIVVIFYFESWNLKLLKCCVINVLYV